MPIQVTKYCCEICGTEYEQFHEALTCESLGQPEQDGISVGQTISFENEEIMFGSKYSYSTVSGIVLLKRISLSANRHVIGYIVKEGKRPFEYYVTNLADNYGTVGLRSPAEWKYNPGFADSLRFKLGSING